MSDIPVRKGRGCFFYGCLTAVVLFLACAVGLYLGARLMVNRAIQKYTVTTPVPVRQVEGTAEEATAVRERFRNFAEGIRSRRAVEPLVLSEKDLNLLIRTVPELAQFKDHLYVSIEGRKLRGTMSLPLDHFGFGPLKGRYFNGAAELKASLENGVLLVTLDSLEVNGQPLPDHVMAGFRGQNLARDLYKDQKSLEILRQLETIEVDDGRVLVKPRALTP